MESVQSRIDTYPFFMNPLESLRCVECTKEIFDIPFLDLHDRTYCSEIHGHSYLERLIQIDKLRVRSPEDLKLKRPPECSKSKYYLTSVTSVSCGPKVQNKTNVVEQPISTSTNEQEEEEQNTCSTLKCWVIMIVLVVLIIIVASLAGFIPQIIKQVQTNHNGTKSFVNLNKMPTLLFQFDVQ